MRLGVFILVYAYEIPIRKVDCRNRSLSIVCLRGNSIELWGTDAHMSCGEYSWC
jgi:hypothetical protein